MIKTTIVSTDLMIWTGDFQWVYFRIISNGFFSFLCLNCQFVGEYYISFNDKTLFNVGAALIIDDIKIKMAH